MADKDITPTPTSTPEPRDFTSMSVDELYSLIETEGKKFVEQTEDGDIEPNDYFATEQFDLTRVMNLFFAFEYFDKSSSESGGKPYPPQYSRLHELTYHTINEYLGGIGLYGPDYIVNL
jgi:hypothetical protein